MAAQKTALIAGGGLAGLTAAVLLDELGFRVTLIERKPILGGRTFSYTDRITGHTVDNGQHIMIGAYHHTFNLLEKIGAKHRVEMLIPTKIPLMDGSRNVGARHVSPRRMTGAVPTLTIGTLPPPWNLVLGLAQFGGLSCNDKIRLISLMRHIGHIQNQQQTVLSWLQQHHQSPNAIQNFWEPLTLATLNDTPENTTVDGLLQVIKNSYFADRNDGFLVFPKNGLSEVFAEPARKYLGLRGCNIITRVGLDSLEMENNRITAFRLTDGEKCEADLFVSALPPWDLHRRLPQKLRENHPQLKYAKDMTGSPVVAVDLFFDRPVMRDRFVGLTNAQTHWFFNKMYGQVATCPYHVSTIISAAHNLMAQDKQTILDIVLNDLQQVACPERVRLGRTSRRVHLVHSTVHKIENATLSSRPGINTHRPEQKILDNFFVIGDWTKTGLPATIESAVKSAFMMSSVIR